MTVVLDILLFQQPAGAEGMDEVHIFQKLLQEMGIDDVHVQEVGGKYAFINRSPILKKTPGFERLTRVALVRDAGTEGTSSAFDSMCSVLRNVRLPVPGQPGQLISNGNMHVGIFIL